MYELDDLGYIENRLHATVVKTKDGLPFIVHHVERNDEDKPIVVGEILKKGRTICFLEDLIVPSPKLGYTNYDGKAFYLGRYPKRNDWRQGLRQNNMFVISILARLNHYGFHDYTPLIVPFLKKYPTYKEALERVEDIYESCAFSQSFALNTKRELIYKNQEIVGICEDANPVLHEQFNWLEQYLRDECNIKQGA